ncbi:hypothetical protein EDD17DRAFT_1649760 [Pisolithus thermaeus]|nr:hypothetical protein EDD17DRAFT_1649760 [Pisolithus thermaeus]
MVLSSGSFRISRSRSVCRVSVFQYRAASTSDSFIFLTSRRNIQPVNSLSHKLARYPGLQSIKSNEGAREVQCCTWYVIIAISSSQKDSKSAARDLPTGQEHDSSAKQVWASHFKATTVPPLIQQHNSMGQRASQNNSHCWNECARCTLVVLAL